MAANLYSESDYVRCIIRWGGKCDVFNGKKKGDRFTDMSPACVGLAPKDTPLERMLALFDPVESSHRVFNEMHLNTSDADLTIGCGHFTNASLLKLFLAMPDNAWLEFRTYVADRLLANAKHFEQYSKDYVVANYLKGKNKTASDIKNATALGESLDYFFGRDLLKNQSYPAVEKAPELKTRYQYEGKSWTVVDKEKKYLSLWADTVILLSSFDWKTGKPAAQYDAYTDYSGGRRTLSFTKYVNQKKMKSSKSSCVFLFPGHGKINLECDFWFYQILYNALLIKSVANWQHELWVKDYYKDSESYYGTLQASNEAILPGLISWKSSGQTTTARNKLPFALASNSPFAYWRNLGDKYYLLSAKEVLVNKTDDASADKQRQELINTCIQNEGELFTALIIWVQFITTKKKMRSRLRAMWNVYFNKRFEQYKDDKTTEIYISHIDNAELTVSDTSVFLDITQKDTVNKVDVFTLHRYTFINKPVTTP